MKAQFFVVFSQLNFLNEVKNIYDTCIDSLSDEYIKLKTKIFLPNNRSCRELKKIFFNKAKGNIFIPEIISPLNLGVGVSKNISDDVMTVLKIVTIIEEFNLNIPFNGKINLASNILNFINSLMLEKIDFKNLINLYGHEFIDQQNQIIVEIIQKSTTDADIASSMKNKISMLEYYTEKVRKYDFPFIVAGFNFSHKYLMDFLSVCSKNEKAVMVHQETENSHGFWDDYKKYLEIGNEEIKYIGNVRKQPCSMPLIESKNIYEEALDVAILAKLHLDKGKKVQILSTDKTFNELLKKNLERWNIIPDDSAGESLSNTIEYKIFLSILDCFSENFSLISAMNLLRFLKSCWDDLSDFELFCKKKAIVPKSFRSAFLDFVNTNGNKNYPGLCDILVEEAEHISAKNLQNSDEILSHIWNIFSKIADMKSFDKSNIKIIKKIVDLISKILKEVEKVVLNDYKFLFENIAGKFSIRTPYGYTPNISLLAPIEAQLIDSDVYIICEFNDQSWNVKNSPFLLSYDLQKKIGLNWADRRNSNLVDSLARITAKETDIFFCRSIFKDRSTQKISRLVSNDFALENDLMLKIYSIKNDIKKRSNVKKEYIFKENSHLGINDSCPNIESLSVSDINSLINNPYEFYARKILNLQELSLLDNSNNIAKIKGVIVHKSIENVYKKTTKFSADLFKKYFKQNVYELIKYTDVDPILFEDWILKIDNIANFLDKINTAAFKTFVEIPGDYEVQLSNGRKIKIKCIADRIQQDADGGLVISDYKTGQLPSASDVSDFTHPQVIVEGLIALNGGFNIPNASCMKDLCIIQLGGTVSSLSEMKMSETKALQHCKNLNEFILKREENLKNVLEKYFVNCENFVPNDSAYYNGYSYLARVKEHI